MLFASFCMLFAWATYLVSSGNAVPFYGYLIDAFYFLNSSFIIGHGGSDGLHAYVPALDYAVSDLVCLFSLIK